MTHLLPEDLETETLAGMSPGEEGYTVAWAIKVDKYRQMWLDTKYSVHDTPGGTVHLLIRRMQHGYQAVKSSLQDYRYDIEDDTFFPITGKHFPVELVEI